MDLTQLSYQTVLLFLLMLVRITGMLISAPFFSQTGVPIQAQVAIAITVSFVLFPGALGHAHVIAPDMWIFSFYVFQELVIGLLLGFVANLTFAAIQMAGNLVSTQMGLSIANSLDPMTNQQSPVIGQFYFLLAIMLFMSLDIHHGLIVALAKSFDYLPIASGLTHFNLIAGRFMELGSDLFSMSMTLILPAFGILLVQEIALSYVSKLMPQMNIFMVALPLKIMVGLSLMMITLPYTYEVLNNLFITTTRQLGSVFQF